MKSKLEKKLKVAKEEEVDVAPEVVEEEVGVDDESEALVTPAPSKPMVQKGIPLGGKARAMRDFLAKQPKVRIMIPLANGEKTGVTQSVILNGYPMYIRKGEYVEVPEQVAQVLEIKQHQRMVREAHPDRLGADGEAKLTSYGN